MEERKKQKKRVVYKKKPIKQDYALIETRKDYYKHLTSEDKKKKFLYIDNDRGICESSKYAVSVRMYRDIIDSFNAGVMKLIVDGGRVVDIPYLGHFCVVKFKKKVKIDENGDVDMSMLYPDWKKTKELWARDPKAKADKYLIYHVNTHTDGYQYMFYWNKKGRNIKNKNIYRFKGSRTNARRLASILKCPKMNVDYFQLQNSNVKI